jgi:Tfp pilus assembly PilM family ATPase
VQTAEAALPEGTAFTSLQADAMPDDVGAVLDARQFRSRPVAVVLDDPSAFLGAFDLAEGFTDELSTGIKWHVEQYVPYPVDQAAVDFRLQNSPYGGQKTVQFVAVDRAVLNKVLELLTPRRVKLRRIGTVPDALMRLYRRLVAADETRREPAALVHADAASGYVVVTHEGAARTVRHVRLGETTAASLVDKVRQTCLHYELHHPTQSVRSLYATPATLADSAVRDALSGEVGLEARALDPLSVVTVGSGRDSAEVPEHWAERFALAVGGAL